MKGQSVVYIDAIPGKTFPAPEEQLAYRSLGGNIPLQAERHSGGRPNSSCCVYAIPRLHASGPFVAPRIAHKMVQGCDFGGLASIPHDD